MSSLKQIRANRENGRRSNGPTTPEGLAASRALLLPEEHPDAFHELLASLHIEHQPVGAHPKYLVRRMAVSPWRLDRLQPIEAGLLPSRPQTIRESEADEPPPDPRQEYLETTRQLGAAFYDDSRAVDSFSKLCRYESAIRRDQAHPEKEIFQNEPNSAPGARTLRPSPRPRRVLRDAPQQSLATAASLSRAALTCPQPKE